MSQQLSDKRFPILGQVRGCLGLNNVFNSPTIHTAGALKRSRKRTCFLYGFPVRETAELLETLSVNYLLFEMTSFRI